MSNRTIALLSALCVAVLLLFHLSAKKQPSGEEMKMFDAVNRPRAWLGRRAPEVTLDLLDGGRFVLSEHVGKQAVVLNFFATWCGPCREETPELVRFAAAHATDPLIVIGVDADEREDAVREFAKTYGVSYPLAIDKGAAQRLFGVRAFPTTVFIGADGNVQIYEMGPISNADIAFESQLRTAVNVIRAGGGITKDVFLQQGGAVPVAEASPQEEKKDPADDVPPGRPREIASKMNCPCGCTHTLLECTCKTAKDIKARLRTMDLAGKTDEEVIKTLNKEFCRK